MGASTIVLLVRLGMYDALANPLRAMDAKLHAAFTRFISWCKTSKRVTSISDFSKQDFDMESTLGKYLWGQQHFFTWAIQHK